MFTIGTDSLMLPSWCKSDCKTKNQHGHKCDGGSYGTYSKKAYSLDVAIALNGASVCHCGAAIDLHNGDVDRTEKGCYRPGYIVMTCARCNADRPRIAEFDEALFRLEVWKASQGVSIMGPTEAKRNWLENVPAHGITVMRSRFYRG